MQALKNTILITGSAGFIGYHLAKNLLEDGYRVLGVDNLNDYYSVKLKKARLTQLEQFDKFTFAKVDISQRDEITSAFKRFNPSMVINLAAQPGVRYSLVNPFAYVDSNLSGFINILELCRHGNVKGLVYASSSSVYGGNKKVPFSETDPVDHPFSLYGATKKANELMAHTYSHLYGLHTTGLRFFTVYGSWYRPDMAMYIFADRITSGKPIPLFNHGNMQRDFTYIDDVVSGIRAAMEKNYQCEIFNLGNHRAEDIHQVVRLLEKYLGKKAEVDLLPMQPGDVPRTFADISRSRRLLGYKPATNIGTGIRHFVDWYQDYHSGDR